MLPTIDDDMLMKLRLVPMRDSVEYMVITAVGVLIVRRIEVDNIGALSKNLRQLFCQRLCIFTERNILLLVIKENRSRQLHQATNAIERRGCVSTPSMMKPLEHAACVTDIADCIDQRAQQISPLISGDHLVGFPRSYTLAHRVDSFAVLARKEHPLKRRIGVFIVGGAKMLCDVAIIWWKGVQRIDGAGGSPEPLKRWC